MPSSRLDGQTYRWLRLIAYTAFACVTLLSSMYCALAYVPVTYFAFIQAPFQGWLPAFARLQGYFFLITFVGAAVSLITDHGKSLVRGPVLEFSVFGVVASSYFVAAQPLRRLGNNSASLVWAIACLLPLIWMGTIDYRGRYREVRKDETRLGWISWARVAAAAVFVGVLSPGATYLRFFISRMPFTFPAGEWFAWVWGAVTHVLLFLFAFGVIDLMMRLANRSGNPPWARPITCLGLWWVAVGLAIYRVVLYSIPFQGIDAEIYAAVLALALVSFGLGWGLRSRVLRVGPAPGSTAEANTNRRRFAAFILLLLASSITVPAVIGAMDWNSLLERSWSMAFWALTGAVFLYGRPLTGQSRWPAWAVGGLAALTLLVYRVGVGAEEKMGAALLPPGVAASDSLAQHAAFDPSFEAASLLLAPSTERYCGGQCEFVRQQTNIPASASLNLHEISLVDNLRPTTSKKPNIFIIVVDSLRQDYISAYNPKVSFTPSISAFANDSVVFHNAFTRYSGTTLAEPSIWSGTLLLHKHFVQPFYLVNNLEKITQIDGYQSFITVDTVLRELLRTQADIVKLDDRADKWTDVDFCSTAADAIAKIDAKHDPRKPVFLYTQPQNVHLLTLAHTLPLRPPHEKYPGFARQYASELERLDGCFGAFVRGLKIRGLYEESVIVLTSDHGEDLEGAGAKIHGFSLKPEIMRIPLIIHLPSRIRHEKCWDAEAAAFNSDITATLYQLLGHGPVIPRPEFGRPLFADTPEERRKYLQDSYIIASSYLPLYGLLYKQGRELFIEDEANGLEQWLDSNDVTHVANNVLTEEKKRKGEAEIRADLQAVAQLYGYQYKRPTIFDWLMR